jgi:glycine dehydrogenase subunit 1
MAGFTPHTENDIQEMLLSIGLPKVKDLFRDIPLDARAKSFDLPAGITEYEAMAKMQALAAKNNINRVCFLGGGYYDHFIPAAVDAVSSRSEFYTLPAGGVTGHAAGHFRVPVFDCRVNRA